MTIKIVDCLNVKIVNHNQLALEAQQICWSLSVRLLLPVGHVSTWP